MSNPNNNPLDTGNIVHKIKTSEAFVRAQNDAETAHLSEDDRIHKSVRMAANILKDAKPSGYLTAEGHAFNVTAQLTTFSDSIHEIHQLRADHAPHSEKLPALRHIAEFNHAVKDMVNSNPSLGFAEVLSFITDMNRNVNGNRAGGRHFDDEIRGVLVGMRHEIAVEQMLWHMPGVTYREATTEEDLKGADIFVSVDGSPMMPFDIKSSREKAERSRAAAIQSGFDGNHIVWSHIDDSDFNGTFRISDEVAKARSEGLHKDFTYAANYERTVKRQYA